MTVGRTALRRTLAATGVLLALTAAGCSTARPEEPTDPTTSALPSSPSTPTTSPTGRPRTTPDPKADMRTRLADALRAQDSYAATLVGQRTTTLDAVDADWLPGWQVVDVTARTMPHPRRFYVGLSSDGQARVLTGNASEFAAMVADARIRLGSATTAVVEAQLFLDSTRTFRRYSYRVEDVSAIQWRTDPSAADQARRDAVVKDYEKQIGAPRATPAGDGWTSRLWMVDGSSLVRHDLSLTGAGAVADTATVVVTQLPVPDSI